jgi:hypothetical protein
MLCVILVQSKEKKKATRGARDVFFVPGNSYTDHKSTNNPMLFFCCSRQSLCVAQVAWNPDPPASASLVLELQCLPPQGLSVFLFIESG